MSIISLSSLLNLSLIPSNFSLNLSSMLNTCSSNEGGLDDMFNAPDVINRSRAGAPMSGTGVLHIDAALESFGSGSILSSGSRSGGKGWTQVEVCITLDL